MALNDLFGAFHVVCMRRHLCIRVFERSMAAVGTAVSVIDKMHILNTMKLAAQPDLLKEIRGFGVFALCKLLN